MKNNPFFFLFCAIVGYGLGWAVPLTSEGTLEFASSEEPSVAINDYKVLPCPSEAEYQDLARQVNLVIPEGPSLDEKCEGESPRVLLAKSLYLMKNLKFEFPETWPQVLKNNLENSLQFLKSHSAKLTLDLMQKDSVAYNKVMDREIYLGGKYFNFEPLAGVAILVHEARHSDLKAMSHVHCHSGDIPWTSGGCDEVFYKNDEEAGAYAYGTLFNIGLALFSKGLAKSDREYALADALIELNNRFNQLPEAFASRVDVLATLDENSNIFLVHPFLGYQQKVDLRFDDDSERPERIELATKHGGLLIFTNKKRVWTWSHMDGLQRLVPKILTSDVQIDDLARVAVPFNGDIPLYVIRQNQKLYYIDYIPEKNSSFLLNYPLHHGRDLTLPKAPFYRTFLAFMNRTIHLTDDGLIYFTPEYGNEPAFGQLDVFKSAHGWIYGTGGVTYSSLYLIDGRGDLKYGFFEWISNPADPDAHDIREYHLTDSEFKATRPLRKFAQGLTVMTALDDQGQIHVWSPNDKEAKILALPKVKDFVIMRRSELSRTFGQVHETNKGFVSECGIAKTLDDPWLGAGMGFNSRGKFVVAGEKGPSSCVELPGFDIKTAIPYYSIQH